MGFGQRLADRMVERRNARFRAAGVVECDLIDPTGETSPLLRRGRGGRASIEPGLLTFEPFVAGGFRLKRPFTEKIRICVVAVNGPYRLERRPEGREPDVPVFEIDTGERTLEWAVPPDVAKWAIRTLDPYQ